MGWELDTVERPLVEQLVSMGWHHTEGHLDDPARSGRHHFTEVLQEDTLRRQLHALNLREVAGQWQPWLDAERLGQAVSALTRLPAHKLIEANRAATELLLNGLTVEGVPGWDGGPRVRHFPSHFLPYFSLESST